MLYASNQKIFLQENILSGPTNSPESNFDIKIIGYFKRTILLNFIDSCIKLFLNKLYTREVLVPNVPKRNIFVKLPFLRSTSFQIQNKLQNLFSDKLTSCNLKSFLRHPLESKPFSPSKISYLRCYFQDLFTSISVVAVMLPIMERPNAILKSEFVNI